MEPCFIDLNIEGSILLLFYRPRFDFSFTK